MSAGYHGMDQAQLDAAYDNQRAAGNFAEMMADFQHRSQALYATTPGRRDLAYGARPRERYDWLACGVADAPTFVFIHGGYWHACTKEDFAFVAAGPLGRGFNVVLAEYTLAPAVTLDEIVAEIGALLDHLAADPNGLGTAGRPLCLSGHSAGGQLTAMHRRHPSVTGALAMSGLYELEPIRRSFLNQYLHLTPAQVEHDSPIRHVGAQRPAVLSVGGAELPGLLAQTNGYAAACGDASETIIEVHVPDCQHFDMCLDLARPDGVQLNKLAELALF